MDWQTDGVFTGRDSSYSFPLSYLLLVFTDYIYLMCIPSLCLQKELLGPLDVLYFADICAGPGGFSEYVLWRKKWHAKGFGFTLKGGDKSAVQWFVVLNSLCTYVFGDDYLVAVWDVK